MDDVEPENLGPIGQAQEEDPGSAQDEKQGVSGIEGAESIT